MSEATRAGGAGTCPFHHKQCLECLVELTVSWQDAVACERENTQYAQKNLNSSF